MRPMMRFADAPHVDLGGFRSRKAAVGRLYWLIGVALCACAAVLLLGEIAALRAALLPIKTPQADAVTVTIPPDSGVALRWLVLISVVGWIRAWQQAIGAQWRGPLVAAAFTAALGATWPHLKAAGMLP